MQKPQNPLDALIADADRTIRRQKHCKKNIHENINKVVQLIEKTQQEIEANSNIMEEVIITSLQLTDSGVCDRKGQPI